MSQDLSFERQAPVHMSIPRLAVAVAVTTALIAAPIVANGKCPSPLHQMAALLKLQADVFAALENEDHPAWERLTTRDFVAFESGQRYGREAVFDLIKYAHGTGKHFSWSVTSPRLEAACTVATLIYLNQGFVIQGASRSAVSWLETATFRYAAGQWRAVFMESMRQNRAE